jgi:uncharacterized membrane protein YhaH (DUF805 family)
MFCKNCGNEVQENLAFCPKCGNQLEKNENPSQENVGSEKPIKKNLWNYFVGVIKEFYNFLITGRCRRAEYWGFMLFYFIFCFAAGFADGLLFGMEESIISDIVITIFAIPELYLRFRRMHDVGKPAGFIFIPIYGFILSLQDRQQGTNKYGPNPKGL